MRLLSRTFSLLALSALVLAIGIPVAGAAPGDLDDMFDSDGISGGTVDADANGGVGVAVSPDQKIVQTGIDDGPGTDDDFVVIRYDDDGSFDTTFDGDGVARIDNTVVRADVNSDVDAAVDSSNQPLLGGITVEGGGSGSGEFLVARFTEAGALDAGFGTSGISRIPNATVEADENSGVALALKGDAPVLGGIALNNSGEYVVAQFTTAGVLDATFGTGGLAIIPNATINADENSRPDVAVDLLSRTLLAGIAQGGGGRYFVSRFTTAGILDATFGTGGIVFIPNATINADENSGVGLALLVDGSPVLGAIDQATDSYFVAQFTAAGVLDTTFDADGIAFVAGIDADQNSGVDVMVQPDGKPLLGAINESTDEYFLSRFTTAGTLDPVFGASGIGMVPIALVRADQVSGVGVALQADGKPVLGGIDQTTVNSEEFFVARFDGDVASLDVTKSGPAIAVPGETVSYTISLTNTSATEAAFDLLLSDIIPAGLTVTDITAAGGGTWTCVVASAACSAAFLPPGGVATFTVTATVDAGVASGVVTNVVNVDAANAFGQIATADAETEIVVPEPPIPPQPPQPPAPPASPEPGPSNTPGGAELPRTGAEPRTLVTVALMALVAGMLLLRLRPAAPRTTVWVPET